MENENKCCECYRHKSTPRSDDTVKALQNRLSRIIGQLGGIKNGDDEVIAEAVELIKKLK